MSQVVIGGTLTHRVTQAHLHQGGGIGQEREASVDSTRKQGGKTEQEWEALMASALGATILNLSQLAATYQAPGSTSDNGHPPTHFHSPRWHQTGRP